MAFRTALAAGIMVVLWSSGANGDARTESCRPLGDYSPTDAAVRPGPGFHQLDQQLDHHFIWGFSWFPPPGPMQKQIPSCSSAHFVAAEG